MAALARIRSRKLRDVASVRRIDVLSTLSAAVCAGGALPAYGQTLTKITVGVNGSDDVTPLLWAKTSGMFARAGLDVDIQKFGSGSIATAAVIGGSLDAARSSLLPLISAHSRGIPVRLIAPGELATPGDPTEGMLVAKDSPVTSGAQLNGTTLPVPSIHDFNEIASRAWIDATGGDSKTVRFIELPISAIVPAIIDGRVPAGMVTDPFYKDAVTAGRVKTIGRPNQAIAKRYLITGYVTTEAFIAAHPRPFVHVRPGARSLGCVRDDASRRGGCSGRAVLGLERRGDQRDGNLTHPAGTRCEGYSAAHRRGGTLRHHS